MYDRRRSDKVKEITKITSQKRKKDRYNIFINNTYSFSVDEDVLVKYKLKKGKKLTDDSLIDILTAESLQKTYTTAVRYLGIRPRSVKELADYLKRKEYEEDHIELVLHRLIREKHLDDHRFTESFVKERIRQKSKGPRLIQQELYEKGIDKEVVEEILQIVGFNEQYEAAMKEASKRAKQDKKESLGRQKEKIRLALMRKGFETDVINEVMNDVIIEEDGDAEWQALVHHGNKIHQRLARKNSGAELKYKVKAGLFQRGFKGEVINRFIDEYIENEGD